MNRHPF